MKTLMERQKHLIQTNMMWLERALATIAAVDDRAFASSPKGMEAHCAGSHLRQIVDFYECFLDGVELGHIDYDAERQDEGVEQDRTVAMDRIRDIAQRLETTAELSRDAAVFVRMDDAQLGEF